MSKSKGVGNITCMTQSDALLVLKSGANVFLTGGPGTGKTFVLNKFLEELKKRKIAVAITASTGIAASHIGGVTIHSWSGVGIRDYFSIEDYQRVRNNFEIRRRIQRASVIVIDEISMLESKRLDLVNNVLRVVTGIDAPFGNKQVVFTGDFYQLPPVTKYGEHVQYAFKSKVWDELNLKICYLHEPFRFIDDSHYSILQALRSGAFTEEHLDMLRKRYMVELSSVLKPTRLFSHNTNVDSINTRELTGLPSEDSFFTMTSRGKKTLVEELKKHCPVPEEMVLKKGAQVMFVKNDPSQKFVNGTLGEVIKFDELGFPVVKTFNEKVIHAYPMSWTVEEEGEKLAEINQVPLKLAWAITIHKSQGMSLDAAEIDLSKSFESGMGYVALSRVRSLEGLSLLGFNHRAIEMSEEIRPFDVELKKESYNLAEKIKINKLVPIKDFFVGDIPEDIKSLQDYEEVVKKHKNPSKKRLKKLGKVKNHTEV